MPGHVCFPAQGCCRSGGKVFQMSPNFPKQLLLASPDRLDHARLACSDREPVRGAAGWGGCWDNEAPLPRAATINTSEDPLAFFCLGRRRLCSRRGCLLAASFGSAAFATLPDGPSAPGKSSNFHRPQLLVNPRPESTLPETPADRRPSLFRLFLVLCSRDVTHECER